ncbi:MAG TPA: hypothetical protein VMI33_24010 [Streptosporangiaceae bacterium]|nr:hypothetical protein [Streptosporangiaceae bacterium]
MRSTACPRVVSGPGTRGARALRRAAVALGAVALGAVALAACGSVPAPASGAPAGASGPASASPSASASPNAGAGPDTLCRDTAAVTGLQIARIGGTKIPERLVDFPDVVTVTSPAEARAVARALCALPAMPSGIFNCPALFPGTSYQLKFTADGRKLPVVTLEATGCETVTGAGPVRQARSAGFWRVLARAGRITPPAQSAFVGRRCQPSGPSKINGCPGLMQPGGAAQSGSGAAP